MKLRKDYQAKKDYNGLEKIFVGVYKDLQAQGAAAKYAAAQASGTTQGAKGRLERAAQKEQDAKLGISPRKSSPVKGNKGQSKGGSISKKERESLALASQTIMGKAEEDEAVEEPKKKGK